MTNSIRLSMALFTTILLMTLPARADQVELTGGDTLQGRVLERHDDHVLFEHPALGVIEIASDRIVSLQLEEGAEQTAPAPETEQDDGAAQTDDEPGEWESHFDLAGSASFGNTDSQNLHVGITSKRETPEDRTTIDAAYDYGANDGDRNANKLTAGVIHDWLIPESRWLYFAQGRYDFDEFQSWEHRLGAHGGVGYDLIKQEDLTLTLRAGAGVVKEFGSEDEDLRPEGLLGAEVNWQITERQTLGAKSTIYPDLGDLGEYRAVSSVDWSMLMDEEANMSLTAGLRHEYQSEVDPGFEHHDLQVFAGLQFDF